MKLRERINPSGKIVYQVDFGIVNGKRVQRSYSTKTAAELAMRQGRKVQVDYGAIAITPAEIAEIVHLKSRLPAGSTLYEAVEFFIKHHRAVEDRDVWLQDAIDAFVREQDGRYYETLRTSLGSLARHHSTYRLLDLTRENVEKWLNSQQWAPKTKNNRLGDVRALLNWCIEKRWLSHNVAAEIPKFKEPDRDEIETLSVAQCKQLLRAAKGHRLQAYVALGLFCGIRREEILRLHWDAVNLDEGYVVLAAKLVKGRTGRRQRRTVDIAPCAIPWLQSAWRSTTGKIYGVNFKNDWPKFHRETAGFAHWPHNALRHTYASYHYAQHQNEALLQAQMGHEDAEMLHKHYRGLRTRREAEEFWSLTPDKV